MKLNIKKVATVLGSALMLGATAGMAAAASFTPSSFGDGGIALVVGQPYPNGMAAASDLKAATDLAYNLAGDLAFQTATGASVSTVTGGDSYKLEKTSTKWNLGDYVGDVVSTTVTKTHLSDLLADGKFIDNDNDEFDFTQKIELNNASLRMAMFDDSDYAQDSPTVGIMVQSGNNILNYTLDFTDKPLWSDLSTADMQIMGKTYYVLSTSGNNSITLLDSATDTILSEGETTTLNVGETSYEVSINYVGATSVKLIVNGQTTNTLDSGQTQKLSDGAYVGVKDILYSAKESGVSKVEFSIGKGKLVLENDTDVVLNDDTISDLSVVITNAETDTKLDDIKLVWNADLDSFVTESSDLAMPGFGAVKLSMGGITYPKTETIEIVKGGDNYVILKDFPLKSGSADINLLYFNGTNYSAVGKEADSNLLRTGVSTITFDGDTDSYFVASWSDGSDAESYLMRANSFVNQSGTQKVDFEYWDGTSFVDAATSVEQSQNDYNLIGSIDVNIGAISRADKTVVLTAQNANVNFNTLYSKEGAKIMLPWIRTTAYNYSAVSMTAVTDAQACAYAATVGANQLGATGITVTYNATTTGVDGTNTTVCTYHPATYKLNFSEEDKNGNKAAGNKLNITLGSTSSNAHVTVSDVEGESATFAEIGSTDVERSFVYSDLATEILWDKSNDEYSVKLIYHGDESMADVYLTDMSATVTGGSDGGAVSSLGSVTVYDNEVSSVSNKNLIVIGGSCINGVAAELLGGAACDDAFTAKTGIKAGEALIQSFTRGSKVALLVAGFNAADTTKAVTYLSNKPIDTTVGKALKVTSATEATAITA